MRLNDSVDQITKLAYNSKVKNVKLVRAYDVVQIVGRRLEAGDASKCGREFQATKCE